MIKPLAYVFLAMFVYGLVVGNSAAALISLGMVAFLIYGARQLDKRDAEFLASAASAKTIPDTQQAMADQEVESSGSRF